MNNECTRSEIFTPITLGNLRSLEPVDDRYIPTIFELVERNRERLSSSMPWVKDTQTAADIQKFFSQMSRDAAEARGGAWVILVEGNPVGIVGVHEINWPHARTSIGYWINAAHEGHGHVTSAVSALARRLFAAGIKRIEIRAGTENSRSRALAERLGFTFEGIARSHEQLHDRRVDHAVYSLLSDDPATGEEA